MEVSFLDPISMGPDLPPISDAELYKYFLNDDIAGTATAFSQAVPSTSPPSFYESTPSTPDPIFSEIDGSFSIKEEISDHSPLHSHSSVDVYTAKSTKSKSGRGSENRKIESSHPHSEEERQMKRQRRLVKNRESAQLSRMRKKIYIDDLEGKVNVLIGENSSLKEEVLNLQNVIKQMSSRNDGSRTTVGVAPSPSGTLANIPSRHTLPVKNTQAAGVCLLIVLFSLGLLFNVTTNNTSNTATARTTSEHRSRREASQFPALNFVRPHTNSDSNILNLGDNLVDIEDNTDVNPHKRHANHINPEPHMEEAEEDDALPPPHKKIKVEPLASPGPLLSSVGTSDIATTNDGLIVDGILSTTYEMQLSRVPVAVAVVVPSHLSSELDVLSTTAYRSLTVHVWPMLQ